MASSEASGWGACTSPAAAALGKGFAYGTNADYGAGGNIHPPYKQHVGQRLANAALSIVYGQPINWRSPTYAAAFATAVGGGAPFPFSSFSSSSSSSVAILAFGAAVVIAAVWMLWRGLSRRRGRG